MEKISVREFSLFNAYVSRDKDSVHKLLVTGPRGQTFPSSMIMKFPSLQELQIERVNVDPSIWSEVGKLENLRSLTISKCNVGDVGVEGIAGLQKLRSLNVRGTHFTDRGIQALSGLKNLTQLVLASTDVETLHGISEFSKLRKLSLVSTACTDNIDSELSGLKQLVDLSVEGTQVTDQFFRDLSALVPLKILALQETATSVNVVAFLRRFEMLETLYLHEATTESVRLLSSLKFLRELYVGDELSQREKDSLSHELSVEIY